MVTLELKVIADVGRLGYPNVGKSTLLSVVSAGKAQIEQTTHSPHCSRCWAVVAVDDYSFVMADIPGLIEGASGGAGLGLEFLRHIERTRLLVHIVDGSAGVWNDGSPVEKRTPLADHRPYHRFQAHQRRAAPL